MTAFANHAAIEFRSSIRNRQLVFLNYAFPLAFYGLMGLIMTQINPMFTETMVPAMVIFAVTIASLMGIPDPLVAAREAGILRSYKIYGIPALNILTIPALTTLVHMAVVTLIIVVTASPLFGAPLPVNWGWFLVVTVAIAVASAGLGVLIGVVSTSTRVTVMWSQLIFLPSMLLSGLMIPYGVLPEVAQILARVFPATYAMNAYRGLAYQLPADFSPIASIIVLLAGGFLAFALALGLFTWDRHNDGRRLPGAFAALAMIPYVAGLVIL